MVGSPPRWIRNFGRVSSRGEAKSVLASPPMGAAGERQTHGCVNGEPKERGRRARDRSPFWTENHNEKAALDEQIPGLNLDAGDL